MKQKRFFFGKKKLKMVDSKKTEIFNSANSQYFFVKNLRDWSLGEKDKLMWLNLFSHQVVQCKLKKG